jgi:cell wall-associated NlpC family hydrolase
VWGGHAERRVRLLGFTKYIFANYRVTLPRVEQHAGRAVSADFAALRPGDLLLFAEPGAAISHVAIYAGNGRIIHASSSAGGVGYTDLNTSGDWFVTYFVAARRVL